MEMVQPQVYFTALVVGILGGVHCLTMCGGLVATLTLGLSPEIRVSPWRMLPYHLVYNLARIFGYAFAGALFGGFGALLIQLDAWSLTRHLLHGLAGVTMILLGLYMAGWPNALAPVERLGARLWRRVEPITRRLMPVRTLGQAAVIGFVWAWIPCGLVYSVLITAIATGSPAKGALVMLAFGLGTLPNLLLAGIVLARLNEFVRRPVVRLLSGALVLGFGLYGLLGWFRLLALEGK